ncbi:hypothetical protein DXG03_007830 [Asterophora parasitica]|uniref:Uncharacterized protein n=1 Tax=Asterophora parasitica TaxID=117018 RepID=A0A9P7KDE1_9AGAR|nr:hypothetical protein DXG03_007830 [Asterophora parasitica]
MFEGRPGLSAFANVDAVMRCLLPFFTTWKFVVIRVGPFLRNLEAFKLLAPDAMANHLTGLDIFLPGSYKDAADDMDLLFHRAPFLRSLQLSAEVSGRNIPDLRIAFKKLTSLSLNTSVFSIDNCVTVLEQCPNLVSFDTPLLEGNFKNVRNGPPVILQHLEELRLGTTTQHLNIFFDSVTFPSLVKLLCICQYPFPADSFVSLVNRSDCILSTLGLYTHLTEDSLLKCLHVCPSMKELDLQTTNSHFVTDRVLERLTFGLSEPPLCPMLENMTYGLDVIRTSDGMFARMLESRFSTGDLRPRHLVLVIAMISTLDNYQEDVACLRKLKELGLLGCWHLYW